MKKNKTSAMSSDPPDPEPKPGTIRLFDPGEVHARAEEAALAARGSFVAFRQIIRPDMLWDWWVEQISLELQLFYEALVAGERPMLAIMSPPQHGKTWAAEDFIAWIAGKHPDWKTIYASYSEDLGTQRSLNLQRIMQSERYRGIFGDTRIGSPGWQMSSNLIEFVDHSGSFRSTTIGGSVTGLELHLGVVDDPVKGRAEANSKLVRDRTWNWYVDDFMSRFAATDSGLLIIMTRWHVDDLLGRLIRKVPKLRKLIYPAIAEKDDGFRRKGEALFPELKPLDFLLVRKKLMTQSSWEAEYQQNPIIVGGGVLPVDKLRVTQIFDRKEIKASMRAWDKAGTDGGDGAYTAGVLMHQMKDGRFVIENVTRGHWGAQEREQIIKQLAQLDTQALRQHGKWNYSVIIEQEPGSGGKESAEATIKNLAGFTVTADKVTGSKEVRAEPFAAQVQGGNVWLVAGRWVADFLEEAEAWPSGRTLDQIDAAAMAFAHLTAGSQYDQSYSVFQD
jgi:predicted phage terminase large subunit-like protein